MFRSFRLGILLTAALVVAGCTPSGFIARQFLRAPKSFPKVVSPQPRVYFSFPDAVTETLPEQLATVGDPAITLNYRLVPPGDYGSRLILTNYLAHGQSWPLYWFPAHQPEHALPSRGTVVLLHGYGLDHGSMVPWALRLAGQGWSCVLVDLRGHGRSEGDRITFGIQEARDLSDLMDELSRRGQASWPVNVVGVSYGAAVALRWGWLEPRVQSVVALTPYGQLASAVEGLRRDYAAWLPEGMLRRATEKLPGLLGLPPGGLDPQHWLEQRPVTALFVAAGSDLVAPVAVVKQLATTSPQSQVLELPNTVHEIAPFRLDLLATPVLEWLARPENK